VSTIIDAANQVLGADASDNDIIGMTLRMATDVIDYGVRPSGLAEADPDSSRGTAAKTTFWTASAGK
jgi:hypothetical protein